MGQEIAEVDAANGRLTSLGHHLLVMGDDLAELLFLIVGRGLAEIGDTADDKVLHLEVNRRIVLGEVVALLGKLGVEHPSSVIEYLVDDPTTDPGDHLVQLAPIAGSVVVEVNQPNESERSRTTRCPQRSVDQVVGLNRIVDVLLENAGFGQVGTNHTSHLDRALDVLETGREPVVGTFGHVGLFLVARVGRSRRATDTAMVLPVDAELRPGGQLVVTTEVDPDQATLVVDPADQSVGPVVSDPLTLPHRVGQKVVDVLEPADLRVRILLELGVGVLLRLQVVLQVGVDSSQGHDLVVPLADLGLLGPVRVVTLALGRLASRVVTTGNILIVLLHRRQKLDRQLLVLFGQVPVLRGQVVDLLFHRPKRLGIRITLQFRPPQGLDVIDHTAQHRITTGVGCGTDTGDTGIPDLRLQLVDLVEVLPGQGLLLAGLVRLGLEIGSDLGAFVELDVGHHTEDQHQHHADDQTNLHSHGFSGGHDLSPVE